ncbi:MAG TPA: TRAM domain-containing protein [Vicinamibacterales bacterium]|nr:TRAM domain-containing protein [Vicinamibacterales bacterium]
MPLQLHSEIVVTIDKPAAGGRMIARHEGQVVFVAGAIPGERVKVRIDRVSKHLAFGDTIEVLDRSADRRSVDADWACGGSFYAHIAYDRQRRLKAEVVEDAFARIAKMRLDAEVSVMASQEAGYRMRARLHAKDGRLGFFREGTHTLCDPGQTQQLLPATMEALRRLQPVIERAHITSCELSENIDATERAILLELAPDGAPANVDPIDGITGLLFIDHQQGHITVAYGSPYVTDRIATPSAPAALTHHVQSFFQGNRYLLPDLVARVLAQVPDGVVTDLYAGVGLFAVSLAASGHTQIVAVEGDRASARDLESNAAPHGASIHVQHLPVERYLQRRDLQRPDTLLLDPPRTGISGEAMSAILALKVPRVVYVSCDPATLARDVKRCAEVGYRLTHIEAFDLFPNTAHVETLAVLTRPV